MAVGLCDKREFQPKMGNFTGKTDYQGNTTLSVAASVGNVEATKMIA
ncbi:Protein 21.1 [Corchorus olitorius]|uniref:Protein 21.1 n=1 Tax=Corchorus olitorius TaxID=93759 RepID=A0A1R3KDR7_9ROSI|nr:Protein 21.1 [Corchorus olitorius]